MRLSKLSFDVYFARILVKLARVRFFSQRTPAKVGSNLDGLDRFCRTNKVLKISIIANATFVHGHVQPNFWRKHNDFTARYIKKFQ